MDLSKLSVDSLKHAIFVYNNGHVPVGGLPIEYYREELLKRGEDGKGYHEE